MDGKLWSKLLPIGTFHSQNCLLKKQRERGRQPSRWWGARWSLRVSCLLRLRAVRPTWVRCSRKFCPRLEDAAGAATILPRAGFRQARQLTWRKFCATRRIELDADRTFWIRRGSQRL